MAGAGFAVLSGSLLGLFRFKEAQDLFPLRLDHDFYDPRSASLHVSFQALEGDWYFGALGRSFGGLCVV